MKKAVCEDEDNALNIAKGITDTIGNLGIEEHLTKSQLQNIIRRTSAITKWGRGELSKLLLAEHPKITTEDKRNP